MERAFTNSDNPFLPIWAGGRLEPSILKEAGFILPPLYKILHKMLVTLAYILRGKWIYFGLSLNKNSSLTQYRDIQFENQFLKYWLTVGDFWKKYSWVWYIVSFAWQYWKKSNFFILRTVFWFLQSFVSLSTCTHCACFYLMRLSPLK